VYGKIHHPNMYEQNRLYNRKNYVAKLFIQELGISTEKEKP